MIFSFVPISGNQRLHKGKVLLMYL